MEKKVYRHEIKYYINELEYRYLTNMFNSILRRDEFSSEKGDYWIRSLYFDTMCNQAYYEKIIGISKRKKIRLRIYDINTNFVKLEVKNRDDSYMLKETVTITRDDCLKLINGDFNVLLNYQQETATKVYFFMKQQLYKPSIIIDYEREAYYCPIYDIRITFDKNVRASKNESGFFSRDLGTVGVIEDDHMILEVKYNRMLPKWIKDVLGTCITNRSSISKYCIARSLLG